MYIDPTTGGLLAQVATAAFVAVSGIVLVFSGKIKAYFAQWRRKSREGKQDGGEAEQ